MKPLENVQILKDKKFTLSNMKLLIWVFDQAIRYLEAHTDVSEVKFDVSGTEEQQIIRIRSDSKMAVDWPLQTTNMRWARPEDLEKIK